MPAPWLEARSRCTPDRLALVTSGCALRWTELAERVALRAGRLRARGIGVGDRVGVLGAASPLFVECVHALDRLGAVLVPLSWRLTPRELGFMLERAGAKTLLHDAAHAMLAREAAVAAGGVLPLEAEPDAADGAEAETAPPASPAQGAPFALLFTSGTTGRPKAAELSRGAVLASAVASAFHLGALPGDRWLACMPLFHVGGLSILWRSVIQGTEMHVQERFDPERVSDALDREAISGVSFTATMLQRVLAVRGGRPAPPALRTVLLGGGPCPEALLSEARELGFPVAPTYGLTEACSQVATAAPGAPAGAGLTPLLGTDARIGPADGKAEPDGSWLPPGEIGEICVRGATLMRGYWRDPEASARALRGGWLHTGDLGRLDPAGGLHVVDRRSDLIVSGGENVYPAEVEAVLLEHPAVAEAAVVGVADAEYGRRPAAWWVARSACEPGQPGDLELRRFCRERLAGFKVPVAFHRTDALPRDAAGKLLRRKLR